MCFQPVSACGDCTEACYLSLRQQIETAHWDDWQVLRRHLDQLRGKEGGANNRLSASRRKACGIFQSQTGAINFTVTQTACECGFLLGRWVGGYGREGRKWRAEEQLHQGDGEGSGIYIENRAIWSPPCHFTSSSQQNVTHKTHHHPSAVWNIVITVSFLQSHSIK